jgi:hypothetical protein
VDQWPLIRRLPDGAIDYDFYRGKAHAQRAMAIRNFFTPKRRRGFGITLTFLARLRTAWKL